MGALAAGLCALSAVAAPRYATTTAVRLRADSLRTSTPLRTLGADAILIPLGQHSDYTGLYRVATAAGDTGWVAAEYLIEVDAPEGDALVAAASATHCPASVARGHVKDLTDQDVGQIRKTPKTTTIGRLRALPVPARRPANARANDIEKTVFAVSGRVIKWGEEQDGDLHLVLASRTNRNATIVLEIPSATCLAGAPADLKAMVEQARADAVDALGPPPHSVQPVVPPRRVTVQGVGFFDFGHSTGHPSNAFELHPVLKIRFP